ncbi:MAG: NfeD family protein [Planctomycetota bacterium]|jgi:membrane-bound serine protease (ClpP class)
MLAQILWILFAVLLLIFCAILLVFEIFIPSLGLLTATALLCLAGGIYIFFQMSATAGWIGVWTAIILIPIVWVLVYKLLPKTRLGRVLELKKVEQAMGGIPDQEHLESLIGQTGIVLTPLRPVGMCQFDGKKVVCVSEAGFIEKQTQVKVIHVEGNKVTVRKNETD